ncbi:hypothetical protein [Streptomyces sp. DH12]|uniref:hypothetical protein n=1 Tax=Streptomyces sp. DH12 TaxID=2857010 RepID=UPI001E313D69|nr:hypothetical protein [Streptomyces sp. DH12]
MPRFASQARLRAIADWLTANHVDPGTVVQHGMIRVITQPDGEQLLRYDAYLLDRGHTRYGPVIEERTTPLLVPPPDTWPT